jgi:hypothetical protein
MGEKGNIVAGTELEDEWNSQFHRAWFGLPILLPIKNWYRPVEPGFFRQEIQTVCRFSLRASQGWLQRNQHDNALDDVCRYEKK